MNQIFFPNWSFFFRREQSIQLSDKAYSMLLELVWQYNTKPVNSFCSILYTCTTTHGLFNYAMKCLNHKFCSLYFQQLISWNPTVKRCFLFQYLTLIVWLTLKWSRGVYMDPKISFRALARKRKVIGRSPSLTLSNFTLRFFWWQKNLHRPCARSAN